VLVTLAGPALVPGVPWWFEPHLPGGNSVWLYLGMGALSGAWLGMGRCLRGARRPTLAELRLLAVAWCLPLLLAPALFSHDVYSYLAQGTILHLGLSPYHHAPAILGGLGHQHLLTAVSPFWRHTTAPYGPLFLGLVSLVAGTGSSLVAGVVLLRVLELVGVALLAYLVPRLARALGADPARALWLVVLSPLVLLELVVPGHNDALMAALMVAGIVLALERRPLAAILVCGLAAAVKLPAAAAIPFIAIDWARRQEAPASRVKVLATSAGATAAMLLVMSAIPGVGFSWLSTSIFSTPQRVRLAITPATGLGWTAAALLRDVGVAVNSRHLESALGVGAFVLVGLVAVALLARARAATIPRSVGLLLLAAAFAGPASWPWYFIWGLVLIAGCPELQRSSWIPLLIAVSPFLVKANGVLALPLQSAPAVLAVYCAAAWHVWRRRGARQTTREPSPELAPAPSA
jgi:alpha-1,6-mannosyltransferase